MAASQSNLVVAVTNLILESIKTHFQALMQSNKPLLYSKPQHHSNYDGDVLTQVPNHSGTFISCQWI